MRDVPFVDTFAFDFATGVFDRGSFGGRDSSANLRIFSAADQRNLLAAANVELATDLGAPVGSVSGLVLAGSEPAQRVLIDVRDFDGNPVQDVFYNGLGGVPDFVATDGTSTQGSFTVFNVPEGEAFFLGGGGGLGVDHVGVFDRSISVKPMRVVPVFVAETGLTGPITDLISQLNVFPVKLSGVGMQQLTRFSDDTGLLQETPLVGFRIVLPSNSQFLVRSEALGYDVTYQDLDTDLSDLGGAVDLTRFVEVLSNGTIQRWYREANLPAGPELRDANGRIQGTGILVGSVFSGNQSAHIHNRIGVFNQQGEPVGKIFQFFAGSSLVPAGTGRFEDTTQFAVLDVPPGQVYVRVTGFVTGSGFDTPQSGVTEAEIFADSTTLLEVNVAGAGVAGALGLQIVSSVRGKVTLSDLITEVTDVAIDINGYAPGDMANPGPIRSQTTFNGTEFRILEKSRPGISLVTGFPDRFDQVDGNVLLNGTYVFKVTNPPGGGPYVDTYQRIGISRPNALPTGDLEVVRNLQVFTRTELEAMAAVAGVVLDPSRGVLIGRVINSATLRVPVGIELEVRDEDGNRVGEMRYFDEQSLPQVLDSTTLRGEFIAFNVPPGPVLLNVSSLNDSGSRFTHVFAGGISSIGTVFVGDAPEPLINVSGQVTDIARTGVSGAVLTFRGQPDPANSQIGFLSTPASGGNVPGAFSADLGIGGRYVVSASAGPSFYQTHNLVLSTSVSNQRGSELFAIRRGTAQAVADAMTAAGTPTTLDPGKGVIFGQTVVKGWTNNVGSSRTITSTLAAPTAVSAVLLNGDSLADIVVANSATDQVSIFFAQRDGDLRLAANIPVGLSPVDLLGQDVDGDGIGDVLVLNQGSSDVSVLLGNVRGIFREDPGRRLQVGDGPIQIAQGDMDGDRQFDDLVILNRNAATLTVFLRTDELVYQEASYSPFSLDGSLPAYMQLRDVDRDASNDPRINVGPALTDVVVVMEGSDSIETYINVGTDLVRQRPLTVPNGSRPTHVIRVDINADGNPAIDRDLEYIVLLTLNGTQLVQVIEQQGNAAPVKLSELALDAGCGARDIFLQDVNGDFGLDLVVLCAGTKTIAIYLGHDDGSFFKWQCASAGCPRPPLATGGIPTGLVTGIFDLVSGLDLVVVTQSPDELVLFSGTDDPLENIVVSVANQSGAKQYDVVYLNAQGQPVTTTATDPSGWFAAVNVDPGNVWAFADGGTNGMRRFMVFPDEASVAPVPLSALLPTSVVTLRGQVQDAVNTAQSDIEVCFSGVGEVAVSTDNVNASGAYEVTVPSSFDSVVRLSEPGPVPCENTP